mgnify:CR=1 FL=1
MTCAGSNWISFFAGSAFTSLVGIAVLAVAVVLAGRKLARGRFW